jgi:hypothetical protein
LRAPGGGGVGRVHRMHHHPGAGSGAQQRAVSPASAWTHSMPSTARGLCPRPPLRQHAPARRRERLRHRAAQSTACAQNQNRVCHDRSP